MLEQTDKYFWNFADNSILFFTLTFFFIISTIQVQGAKEQFERTKPHVNIGTVDSTTESYKYTIQRNESVTGPKDLGGHRLAISIGGSGPLPIKQASRDLFESERSFSAGRFALTLDGTPYGSYLITWMNEFFAAKSTPKTVKIYLLTKKNKEKKVRKFYNAFITEVKFPTLDRSSRKQGYLIVKVKAEKVRLEKTKNIEHKLNTDPKLWQASNFRVEMGGLPCKFVSVIESLSIKYTMGNGTTPTKVEIPNIKFTISTADWGAWENWYNATRGSIKKSKELSGSITFMSPDMKTELSEINVSEVRLVSLRKKRGGRFFEAELSVSEMNFESL